MIMFLVYKKGVTEGDKQSRATFLAGCGDRRSDTGYAETS